MSLGLGLGLGFGAGKFSSFVPTNISGCVMWLRADLGVTIGTGVSAWADQSGSGDANKNVTQATGAKQPTLNATDATYNNRATLSFASASVQSLRSGTWAVALPQPSTIIVVGNFDGAAANEIMVDDLTLANQLIYNASGASLVTAYAGIQANYSTPASTPIVAMAVFNGGSSSFYVNANTARVSGNFGANGRTGIVLGVGGDNATAPLNGKVAEVIVYNSALGLSDRNNLLTYLGARYSISIGA